MSEPITWGQRRVMIYKPRQRLLEDGCISCNGSLTWCDSIAPERCCQLCSHRPALDDAHAPNMD